MGELEKKFYNELDFYKDRLDSKDRQNIAFAFKEIAEKDYEEKLIAADHNIHRMPHKFKHFELFGLEIKQLQKENEKLRIERNKEFESSVNALHDKEEAIIQYNFFKDEIKKLKKKLAITKEKIVEVLDRGKINQVITETLLALNLYKGDMDKFVDNFVDDICQLIPKEGIIVFEGAITLGGDNGLTKYAGKKGKLIFIEDKEK